MAACRRSGFLDVGPPARSTYRKRPRTPRRRRPITRRDGSPARSGGRESLDTHGICNIEGGRNDGKCKNDAHTSLHRLCLFQGLRRVHSNRALLWSDDQSRTEWSMMKKWVKYLLAVLYELGVFTAFYFIVKYFADKVV